MPQVPDYGGLKVNATTGPDTQLVTPTTDPGLINADQLKQLGAAGVAAGVAGGNIATDQFDLANQVKVNDAMNKARESAQALTYDPQQGYLNLKGDAALTRPSGQALPDEYGQKLQDSISNIASGLTTDAQRRSFAMQSGALATQFQGGVEQHMLSEFRDYALSTQDGTINLASDAAKRAWNNPDAIFGTTDADGTHVGGALDSAKAAVYQKGKLLGWSGAQTDAALLATTSKVHTDVVMAALENNNPAYALGYLNLNKGSMTADDILRVQGQVNQSVWAQSAIDAVQKATTDLKPQIQPTSFDRMTQITAQTESGNKDFGPDGTFVTSSAGAQGKMQVMPATAANPGFGIKPADMSGTPQQQAAELSRVGTQYLQALVQKYGDPAKAWAAYNAGPGAVDNALKQAQTDTTTGAFRGGQPGPGYWLTLLPKETQDYVAKNTAALATPGTAGAAGSVPPRPTEMDFVTAAVGNLPPGSAPQLVMKTREQAVQQFAMITKSLNEQGQNALSAAQRWLAANNGDINSMPTSLSDAVTQNAPGDMFNLTRYARTIAKGENVSDMVLYNRLASHIDEAAAMPDAQFEMLRSQLSQADFKHFATERASYINGATDDSAGGINSKALNTVLTNRLEALGIDSAPKPTDTAGREQVGGIQQFARNSIFQQQQQLGRKMTPAEIETHINGLFSKDVTFRRTILGFDAGTTTPAPLMSLQVGDIPSDTLDSLKASFASRGKANPTNTDLINAYRTYKLGQQ